MPQYEVRLPIRVQAPVSRVFAFFADHEQFATLFGARCRRIRTGEGDPNGLGSVRRIGPGALGFDETIIGFEPDRAIDYSITRGGPLKNHLGRIRFADEGGATAVDYVIRFDARMPFTGPLLARALETAWKLNAPRVLKRLEG